MSDTNPNRLSTTFFTVTANAFADSNNLDIVVRVNSKNTNIISLEVGGFLISTDRDNWGAIFKQFAALLNQEVVEQTRTVKLLIDDTRRTAELKLVTE